MSEPTAICRGCQGEIHAHQVQQICLGCADPLCAECSREIGFCLRCRVDALEREVANLRAKARPPCWSRVWEMLGL